MTTTTRVPSSVFLSGLVFASSAARVVASNRQRTQSISVLQLTVSGDHRSNRGAATTTASTASTTPARPRQRQRPLMSYLSQLQAANDEWRNAVAQVDSDFFQNTAKGQAPKVLWIGCADSRVPESVVLAAKPGDLFVHRNIAKYASRRGFPPPLNPFFHSQFHPNDDSALSVLTYAVEHLGVEHGSSHFPSLLHLSHLSRSTRCRPHPMWRVRRCMEQLCQTARHRPGHASHPMAYPAHQARRLARSRFKAPGRGRQHPGQSHLLTPTSFITNPFHTRSGSLSRSRSRMSSTPTSSRMLGRIGRMSASMAGSTNSRPASLRIWTLPARRRGPRNNVTANVTSSVAHAFSGLVVLCTHKAEKGFTSFIEKNEISTD